MLFFAALPIALALWVAADALAQQSVSHFIDPSAILRRALLVVITWAMTGWWIEAETGARVAEVAEACQAEAKEKLRNLNEMLYGMLGEGV